MGTDTLERSPSLHPSVRTTPPRPRPCPPLPRHPYTLSNTLSSAMRMKRPLRAWRKYAARGSASTSVVISSRRGSGCMTIDFSGSASFWGEEFGEFRV